MMEWIQILGRLNSLRVKTPDLLFHICGSARRGRNDLKFLPITWPIPPCCSVAILLYKYSQAKPSLLKSFADSKMARIAVPVSVIFFLLVSAQAFVPTESLIRSESWILTDSDTEPASSTILLPSEKPEGKIISNFEWKADANREQLPESEVTVGKLTENEVKEASKPEFESEIDGETIPEIEALQPEEESVPPNVETVLTFRPMNRQFQRMHEMRRPFPFRMPHRCRHHFKPMGPRFINRQIPFGNDMIMAKDEEAPAETGPVFRGGRVGQHPARWVKLHHRGPKIPMGHKVLSREDFKRTQPRLEREDMERGPRDEQEHGGGGLFKGFRKFLNRF